MYDMHADYIALLNCINFILKVQDQSQIALPLLIVRDTHNSYSFPFAEAVQSKTDWEINVLKICKSPCLKSLRF